MKNKNLYIVLGILIIIVFIYFQIGITSQSVLSVSSVNVGTDGKVYWVFTGSVNNMGESAIFTYPTPSSYTKTDGTKITPQQGLSLTLSKQENNCLYRATKQTKHILLLFNYDYYILNNPEREALIKITDGNSKSTIIDGTIVQSETITDSDGKGSVTVQTQGILAGKTDCANYENVAIYSSNNQWKIVYKDQLMSRLNSFNNPFTGLGGLLSYLTSNVAINSQFINSFTSLSNFDGNQLKGNLDFGNVVLTISADQDYFDSVVYLPPKDPIPQIDDVVYPSEIGKDLTGTMKVLISNKEQGTSGTIVVKATSSNFVITPSSLNTILSTSKQVNFNLKAQRTIQDNAQVKIEICNTPQFGTKKCDTGTITIDIVSSQPNEYCGDNVCQFSESNTTCPEDCLVLNKEICGDGIDNDGDSLIDKDDPDCTIKCKAWFSIAGKTIIPDIFCEINKWLLKFRWIFSTIIGLLGGLLGLSYTNRFVDKKFIQKNKWIYIVIFIIIGGALFYLSFIYFWFILISLIILGLIKAFIPGI